MKTENVLNNALNISKLLITTILKEGDRVVDATLGNGFDALFLSECVGPHGHVYAFDIQEEAFAAAENTIPALIRERITFVNSSHEQMHEQVSETVKLILFNLGYLPGAPREIITRPESTVRAVQSGLRIIGPHGVIMLVVYRGHAEGKSEWDELVAFTSTLEQKEYNVMVADFPNQKNNPPALISIQKRK